MSKIDDLRRMREAGYRRATPPAQARAERVVTSPPEKKAKTSDTSRTTTAPRSRGASRLLGVRLKVPEWEELDGAAEGEAVSVWARGVLLERARRKT